MSQLPSEASVIASIAPKHYGVACRSTYHEKEDAGQTKYWDNEYELWRVNKMTWYIEKGDDLVRARKIEFPFFRSFSPDPSAEDLIITETLHECALDIKPLHPRSGKSSTQVEHVDFLADTVNIDVVTKNCTLKTDLSVVPKSHFKKKSRISRTDGSTLHWWELHYKLLVTIQSGPMLFSIQCGGKEYGQASTEY